MGQAQEKASERVVLDRLVRRNSGFTLIELLIVVTIIGILAAIAIGGNSERKEFMEYCQGKGHFEDDCRWEYERMKNGEKSDMIIFMR